MKNKKIFGKKQILMAALVLALGGAVWLNMQYSSTAGGFVTGSVTSTVKNLGDTKYVGNISEGETVQTAATPDYFSEAVAARKAARDEALSLLEQTVKDVNADSTAKAAATQKMAVIAECMEKEASIETLIKAKGFEKVVVVIGDNDVNVVIKSDDLLPSQTLQIQDAVTTVTEISLENIKIVNIK